MTFYHQTLYDATNITQATVGNFLNGNKEDILICTGKVLKLLRFEPRYAMLHTMISVDIFDTVCAMGKFRKKRQFKDSIVITTERGFVIVLVVNDKKMAFEWIIEKQLKIDIPRKFLLHYLTFDFQGRAFCTAAIEAMQFWIYHGKDNRNLAYMEFSVDNTVIYDITFVDDNSENFVLAYLAASYEYEIGKRPNCRLIFSNISKDGEEGERDIIFIDHANSLISVPGEKGVLVCSENFLTYYPMNLQDGIVRCSIPKRITDPLANVIFVCFTKYNVKTDPNLLNEPSTADASSIQNKKKSIYYFAQTEQGDIFKIQVVVNERGVNEIILKYFITLPLATALCVLEGEFLFVVSESHNHYVYKIADIENDAKVHSSFSSSLPLPEGKHFFFMHRTLDIAPVSEIKSISPIMQFAFSPCSAKKYQWCLASGRGSLSKLTISERDVIYQFHTKIEKEKDERPIDMWAVESIPSISQEAEMLIVISFVETTAVYAVKNNSAYFKRIVKEEALLALNSNTLYCAKIGEDAIIQVCPVGVCLITAKKNHLVVPVKENLIHACTMNKQTLILAYRDRFLEPRKIGENGSLLDSKIPSWEVNGNVTCLLLSANSGNDQLLAVGLCTSNPVVSEVHLFNVFPETRLLCKLCVESSPYSFCFMNIDPNQPSFLVGCENGKVLTIVMEKTYKGCQLNIMKIEAVGARSVRLLQVCADEKQSVLAISDESWCKETVDEDFTQVRVALFWCICFIPKLESVATVSDALLRAVEVENLHCKPQVTIPLDYTPKKLVTDPLSGNIIIIESDNNSYTEETKEKKRKELEMHIAAAKNPHSTSRPPAVEKIPKSWASLIRVIKFHEGNVKEVAEIRAKQREAALSLCYFKQGNDNLLLVGLAKDFNSSYGCCAEGAIQTFQILEEGQIIKFLHKTHTKSAPLAMCCYEKKVLIGIGRKLALYSVRLDGLQLVCEEKECVFRAITAIYPVDERIWVNDLKCGMSCLLYESRETLIHIKGKKEKIKKVALHLLEKDIKPNEVTAACILSGDRMVRATISGNIFIVQLGTLQAQNNSKVVKKTTPVITLPLIQREILPAKILTKSGSIFTLSQEKLLACIYLGEIVSSIQTFKFSSKAYETVVYATLSGSVGILSELKLKENVRFLDSVYKAMLATTKGVERSSTDFLCSHAKFRSQYYQCQNVIDGDYLGHFVKLDKGLRCYVKNQVGKTPQEILAKIESTRRDCLLDFLF
ncbi:splicing factor 3B subunit 3-like isoform X2 [Argiope bruennichi]|uniref:splicing factor 3B subunit 3-like isoform X2 n=1 Tax=Argiope bruennichi TaxID=94029 RepID=UPI0024941995|nr:splicing factor 3B subunit 3-like isoform X2 [Argiope bruennichi]